MESADPAMNGALLTPGELRMLLDLHRILPGKGSPLAMIMEASPEGTENVFRKRGLLDPAWREALVVLAVPQRQTRSILALPDAVLSHVHYAKAQGDWVGCWPEGDRLRIIFFVDGAAMLAPARRVFHSSPIEPDPDNQGNFGEAGLSVLLAGIDSLRAFLFRSLLSRNPAIPGVLDPLDLENQLKTGLEKEDARWVVTLFNMLLPAGMRLGVAPMEEGLEELEKAGLLVKEGDLLRPTERFGRLAATLRNPLPAMALEMISLEGGEVREHRHRILLQGDGPIRVFDMDLTEADPSVRFEEMDRERCLTELHSRVGAAPPAMGEEPKGEAHSSSREGGTGERKVLLSRPWLVGFCAILAVGLVLPLFSEETAGVSVGLLVPLSALLLSIFARARWFVSGAGALLLQGTAFLTGLAGGLDPDDEAILIILAISLVAAGLCSLVPYLRWERRKPGFPKPDRR